MQKKNNSSIVIIIIVVFLMFLVLLFTTFGKTDKGGQGNSVSDIILQQTAVQQLANESGKSVDYYAENGVMRHLNFEWTGQAGQSPQEVLSDFLNEYVDLFNITDIDQQLRLSRNLTDKSDFGDSTYCNINQIYNGIPVYGCGNDVPYRLHPVYMDMVMKVCYISRSQRWIPLDPSMN